MIKIKIEKGFFGNDIKIMELSDFHTDDQVEYDNTSGLGGAPKYLSEHNLVVERVNRKRVRVICKAFLGEHWDILPEFLKIKDSHHKKIDQSEMK